MTVLVFGTFDSLHAGHRYFFRQALAWGDRLTVVVARDSYIRHVKRREPRLPQRVRLEKVLALSVVRKALLGDEWPNPRPYRLLEELEFDVLALGYDQKPDDDTVRRLLERAGKEEVKVVRLKPYRPEVFKSSSL